MLPPSDRLSTAALSALPVGQLVALIEAGVVRTVSAADVVAALTNGAAAAYALTTTSGANAGPAIPTGTESQHLRLAVGHFE